MPDNNLIRQIGKYSGMAFLLPTAAGVGYGIGYGLDKLFHAPFLRVVFLLIGIAAGFIDLIRELNRDYGSK